MSVGLLYQYFPNKAALVTALIDLEQERLALAVDSAVKDCAGSTLGEGPCVLARLAIAQQCGDPVFAAALDYEEPRLPLGTQPRRHDRRLGQAVMVVLVHHRSELAADCVWPAVARDLLLITRALVEADAQHGEQPAPDPEHRLVRALSGYLMGAVTR